MGRTTSKPSGIQTGPEEDRLLTARVQDAVAAVRDGGAPRFLGFLGEHAAALAKSAAAALRFDRILLFGGYEGAERVQLGVFPDWCEPDPGRFPVRAVTVYFRRQERLTHRDFLGSLMSLGIKREAVGDILTAQGKAVLFLSAELADYVIGQLDRVGGEGVRLVSGVDGELPAPAELRALSATVASERLDCVVGALCGFSRGKSAALIEGGLVSLRGAVCLRTAAPVQAGDKISVRGEGRFLVDEIGEKTRKGRIILSARKYI